MMTWVIYDITENKIRNKVAKACKQVGLYRVQKSVFLGNLNTDQVDVIALQCEELIDPEEDSVYIFPLCEQDFRKIRFAGNAFDKKYVSDQILEQFF